MSPSYLSFFGKARVTSQSGPDWHPAAYHALDVAAVASVLLAQGIGLPPPPWDQLSHRAALVTLIACHDAGKFTAAFQGKSPSHWPAVLGPYRSVAARGHDQLGYLMLKDSKALGSRLMPIWPDWAQSARALVLRSVTGHHGRPPDAGDPGYAPWQVQPAAMDAARAFIADVIALLHPVALPAPDASNLDALGWWLAGITVLADWIGSNEEHWFHYHAPDKTLDEYWHEVALPSAQTAVKEAGVLPAPVAPHVSLAQLMRAPVNPSPMQLLAQTADLGASGPVMILIEDQTGSGKTEAALLLAHRLMAAGRASGLFVALPTMATANGLYNRLADAYMQLFAPGSHPSLVLAHGRRNDNRPFTDSILAANALAANAPLAEVTDAAGATASAQCAAWIAADRRRTFLAEVGVGTIDQALLAVLPSRHAPLRLHGLYQRVLIIDEAHAYDPYMSKGMMRLVRFHASLGGSTIILSATLPQATRRELVAEFGLAVGGLPAEPASSQYPLVTIAQSRRCQEIACLGRRELARTVEIERIGDPAEVKARICAAANAGQAVAWIRNSIADALESWRRLRELGIEAMLFHSRFAMGDRTAIENKVVEKFGRASKDRRGVVIATQVIEQSLDLDFDLMVSDLAPVELLIQRMGRLWRHDRTREGRTGTPRFLLFAPPPVKDAGAGWLLPHWRRSGLVYPDHALLWRSVNLLGGKPALRQPEDVRDLVEAAYAENQQDPPGLAPSANRADGKKHAHEGIAEQNLLSWQSGYSCNTGLWADDVNTPTRLGDPSRIFRLAKWHQGRIEPWISAETPRASWSLSEIALPLRLASDVPAPPPERRAAVEAAKADWGIWDREEPLLVLEWSDLSGWWVGVAIRETVQVRAKYLSSSGLAFD